MKPAGVGREHCLRAFAGCLPPLFLALGVLLATGVQAASYTLLRFVTYAKERPAEEFRKMEPFQRHLESALAERGFRVKIDLRIFATYEEAQASVISGDFDFGRLGPASYVLVRDAGAPVRLLVVESSKGTATFSGAIFVRQDSPIRKMSDIRGKTFAFGDDKSTTGRFLPQAALLRAGIKAKDLRRYAYLDRHDRVVSAIATGQFEVGAANDRTLEKYVEHGFRKIHSVITPTEPWVVSTRLDPRLADALRQALLTVDRQALKYLDRDGFLPGKESDFDTLREEMRLVDQFGG